MREPGNGEWDLYTLVQNDILPLEADVFGPSDETGEVPVWVGCPDLGSKLSFRIPIERRRHDNAPMPKFLAIASNEGFFFA